ncbi:MAG: hypothetical protein E4H13_08500, partial [Calditrichales bacterium]
MPVLNLQIGGVIMLKRFVLIYLLLIPLALFGQTRFQVVGEPQRLAGGNGDYFHSPVWSPDGQMIAFTSTNYKGLWTLNVENTSITNLSDEAGVGFGFQWSGDSKDIVSRGTQFENARRLDAVKLFNVESKTEKSLTEYRNKIAGLPQWTSDSRQIYFFNGKSLEFVSSGKLLKADVARPVYFTKYGKIYTQVYPTTLAKSSRIVVDDNCLDVRVSPDGRKISYQVMGGNLFVMNTDGSGTTDLGKGHNARWSPDSEYLVYMIATDDGHDFTGSDLYVSRADGSERVIVTRTDD